MGQRPWTGACLCGACSYAAEGVPLASLICHCRDCQRASGAAGLPVVVMPRQGFAAQGPIRTFTSLGGSGSPTQRNFCTTCGSLLFGLPSHAPGIVTLYAGTLDEPWRFAPTFAQFTSERHALAGHGLALIAHEKRAQ
jgi:hypothetical protein